MYIIYLQRIFALPEFLIFASLLQKCINFVKNNDSNILTLKVA